MALLRRPRGGGSFAALLLAAMSSGCDIVQGLSDAGNAIFPPARTHVNAPGSLLAAGNFSELDYASVWFGEGVIGFKLLARTALPGDDSLSVIGFTDGSVCRVEHVGAYRTSGVASRRGVMLAYLDGPGPRGTLRFVDPECEVLPAVLPDATLSSVTTSDGRRVVLTGDNLVIVDASSGDVELLESAVERVTTRAIAPYLVQADGHLSVYDEDWQLLSRHGEGVVRFGYVSSSATIALEDANGIWIGAPTAKLLAPLSPTGCDVGFPLWQPQYVTFRAPCSGGNAVAFSVGTVTSLDLGPDIDTRHVEFWTTGTPGDQARWVAHFRDVDEEAGLGTLVLRSQDGRDLILGERAAVEWVQPSLSGTSGIALLNVSGEVGDLARFETNGSVELVAERALRTHDGTGMIVGFDGEVGDLVGATSMGGFALLLPRVPRENYMYVNRDATVGAAFNDFDGRTGTLSRFTGGGPERELVATRVLHPHHGFIEALFPGMAWIRAGADGETGTLEYTNSDLVYTATVSEGVASFMATTEGLIYAVPHGPGAGVWFADAK